MIFILYGWKLKIKAVYVSFYSISFPKAIVIIVSLSYFLLTIFNNKNLLKATNLHACLISCFCSSFISDVYWEFWCLLWVLYANSIWSMQVSSAAIWQSHIHISCVCFITVQTRAVFWGGLVGGGILLVGFLWVFFCHPEWWLLQLLQFLLTRASLNVTVLLHLSHFQKNDYAGFAGKI